MSDVVLTVQAGSRTGVDLVANKTTVVTANNYYMPNDGNTRLHVKNATGSTCIVTIDTPGTVDSNAIANPTVSILTAKEFLIGPFPKNIYDDATGRVKFNFDQTVDINAVRG